MRARRRSAISFRAVNLPDTPGYDPGLQRHHLLPRQLLSKTCFGAFFDNIARHWPGLDDFRSNGMLLPASDEAALRTGLPLHRGPHRDYNVMVIERVGQVEAHWSQRRWRSPQAAGEDAAAWLQSLQRDLRRGLLDPGRRRLSLNRFDPLGRLVDFTRIDALAEGLWSDYTPWPDRPAAADQTPPWATALPLRAAHRVSSLAWA